MARTWILLRGLTREVRHWGEFPNALAAADAGARVCAIDLPGNGRYWNLRSPARIEDIVSFCRADLRARGIAPPYHLLALSLGAMVAASWCTHFPADLGGAVLINTSCAPFSPFWQRLRPPSLPILLRAASHRSGSRAREQSILALTSAFPAQHHAAVSAWQHYAREYPVSMRNMLLQLLAAMRFRALPTSPPVPLLVLAAAADRLVDCACSQALAQRWQAALQVNARAGHDLPLDDGPWVIEQICGWLDRTRP